MEQYPSLSQSIYAIRHGTEGGLVATPVITPEPPRSGSGCWIAGFVITIIIIALVIWLVVVLVNNPDNGCVDNSCNGYGGRSRSCRVASTVSTDIAEYNGEDDLKEHAARGIVIIFFIADWCGHCKNYKPEIAKAAAALAEKKSPHTIMTCTDGSNDHTKSAQQMCKIRGFPTAVMVETGKTLTEHKSATFKDRSAEAILAFLEEHA
jgi:thiol-disulfide isomerase/thioredoxin